MNSLAFNEIFKFITRILTLSKSKNIQFYFSALVNSRSEYLLNGEFIISMYPQTIDVLGGSLQYSGSETLHERINSTGMLREDILVQVSLHVNLIRLSKQSRPRLGWSMLISVLAVCQIDSKIQ